MRAAECTAEFDQAVDQPVWLDEHSSMTRGLVLSCVTLALRSIRRASGLCALRRSRTLKLSLSHLLFFTLASDHTRSLGR